MIFGIGLARTGTRSLTEALKILGYQIMHNPLHFDDIGEDGAVEGYALCNWRMLQIVYPDAKFIVTTRHLDTWLESSKRAMKQYPIEERKKTKYWPYVVRNRLARWGCVDYDEHLMKMHHTAHELKLILNFFDEDILYLPVEDSGVVKWAKLSKFLGVPYEQCNRQWPHIK